MYFSWNLKITKVWVSNNGNNYEKTTGNWKNVSECQRSTFCLFTNLCLLIKQTTNNNKLYLHDHNKVLQYCKSYLKILIDSL